MAMRAMAPSMATRPRPCSVRSELATCSLPDGHGKQFRAFARENDLGKRTRGRPMQDRTILHGKKTLVAGACEAVVLGGIVDGAGEVRAFLAVGDVVVFTGAD